MIGKTVEATVGLTINNQKMEYDAILIDGTTYAPVRMLGEATGHIVRYNSETGVTLIKKITTPRATVLKSIDSVNSSISTNERMIAANEEEIAKLQKEVQSEIVRDDIKTRENSIARYKKSIDDLNEQIAKLNQTLADIDAQEAELSK